MVRNEEHRFIPERKFSDDPAFGRKMTSYFNNYRPFMNMHCPTMNKHRSPMTSLVLCALIAFSAVIMCAPVDSVLAQDYYGDPQPRRDQRPQTIDPQRAERDYVIPENDPYLAPRQQISPQEQYCRQLEQRLARDWHGRNQGMDELPRIKSDMRKARQTFKRLERKAERAKCYEYFLFSKTVRRTRRCHAMHKKIKKAERTLGSLEAQHKRLAGSKQGNNFQRNELISSLARNGCGRQYQQAARNNNSWGVFDFLKDDRDVRAERRDRAGRHHMPFATYRTMCVRLCDGYYFPVSFSAMQSKFGQDNNACQSKCAAPAKLFVYQNPGGTIEAMTSIDGIAYNEIPNAWKYRKTFVKGCSCKMADYDPVAVQNFERGLRDNNKKSSGQASSTKMGANGIGNNARPVAPQPSQPTKQVHETLGSQAQNLKVPKPNLAAPPKPQAAKRPGAAPTNAQENEQSNIGANGPDAISNMLAQN